MTPWYTTRSKQHLFLCLKVRCVQRKPDLEVYLYNIPPNNTSFKEFSYLFRIISTLPSCGVLKEGKKILANYNRLQNKLKSPRYTL